MDVVGTTSLSAPPERVFAEVCDLGTYPGWLSIVDRALPVPSDGDGLQAWAVDLAARLGPLRHTKQVRMVRTEHRRPSLVRFDRRENDGLQHSPWVLSAEVAAGGGGSVLTMRLHYGGIPSLPFLEGLLHEEMQKAGERLGRRLEGTAG